MLRMATTALTLVCLLQPSLAQNKQRINAVITNATSVYVISDEGDVFSPRVSLEDRNAIHDLEAAIRKWGRYRLAMSVENADIIFVIHSEGNSGILGSATKTITRGDAGPDEDSLFVYLRSQYPNGGQQWSAAMRNGLASPRLPLFQMFKDQVEEVAGSQKPSKAKRP